MPGDGGIEMSFTVYLLDESINNSDKNFRWKPTSLCMRSRLNFFSERITDSSVRTMGHQSFKCLL